MRILTDKILLQNKSPLVTVLDFQKVSEHYITYIYNVMEKNILKLSWEMYVILSGSTVVNLNMTLKTGVIAAENSGINYTLKYIYIFFKL